MYSSGLSYRRRPDRSRARRWLALLSALALLLLLAGPLAVAYRVAHPAREQVSTSPAELGLAYQDVKFPGSDGGDLPAWLLKAEQSDTTVIFVHDYAQNRLQGGVALPLAKALVGAGYNVLLFDQRGHGTAPPDTGATFGGREPADLALAVSYVKSLGSAGTHVVLAGWSLGANAALRTAAERPEVESLVLDSPFTDVGLSLDRVIDLASPYPTFFFTTFTRWLAILFFGARPAELQPLQEIRSIAPRPLLLMHGEADAGGSERLLHLSGRTENELYVAPGSLPAQVYASDPEAYATRLIQFLRRSFARSEKRHAIPV